MIPTVSLLIGVDVGSTATSAGLVTPDGEVLSTVQTATHRDGPGTALQMLHGVIDELLGQADARRQSVAGIGIGLAGIVDTEAGMLRKGLGRLPELSEIPLAECIRERTGLPVFLDNDVNALALGEWTWGLGRETASLVMLGVGTGVGGALILGGRLARGAHGYGGEFGHVSVKFDGRLCLCGARGCLTAYVAGVGIATEALKRWRGAGYPPPVPLAADDGLAYDAQAVFEAATTGDAIAQAVVEEACQALGAAVAGLVNGLNPGVIVVTGGIVRSLVSFQREILDYAREFAFAPALAATWIHLVPGDKRHTVWGGAALVLYEQARRAGRL